MSLSPFVFRRRSQTPAFLAGLFLTAFPLIPATAQLAVTTQNGDNARTGADTVETELSPAALRGGRIGKLFTITGLEANVNGQVLYVPAVTINGAVHNALYAYTSNNADNSPCGLWAFDADTGATLWHDTLPNSATYTTATPVIDTATGILYVLSKTGTDASGLTYLHAYDITTGTEKTGSPLRVQATAAGTGDGAANGVVSFDGTSGSANQPFHANDRPGLLLLNGVVYATFAHNTDSYPYHGWVLGYQYTGAGFVQKYVFCTTPNGSDGGIWMSGKGPTVGPDGNIYLSVGNGTFDANTKGVTSGTDYGMCFLKLSPSLQVLDWFSPHDEGSQSQADLDTSNTGLVALPGTSRLFGGATKFGSGFLLESSGLGGFTAGGPDKAVQRIDGISGNSRVGQNPIAWDAGNVKYVYLWPRGSNIQQFTYDTATGALNPAGIAKQTSSLTDGGALAVSADGTNAGVLWAVGSNGVLHALDATDVSQPELWNSSQNSRDALGSVGHFQFPTITNGKVYVPTGSASIALYGQTAPNWTARWVSAGTSDNTSRLLWTRSDGVATVWKLDTSGNLNTQQQYGPYPGWTAKGISTGGDGRTRLLWANANGTVSFYLLDANNAFQSQQQYGPYSGWTVKSVAAVSDGTARALWTNADGTATIWTLDSTNHMTGQQQYGPYAGWAAKSLDISPDGTERLLWTKSDGTASFWRLNSSSQMLDQHQYGPYAGYTAQSIAAAPDGTSRVAWAASDAHIALWTIDANNAYNGIQTQYGPYSGWAFQTLSVGPDDNARLLWDNISGQAALWSLAPSGSFASNYQFGPY